MNRRLVNILSIAIIVGVAGYLFVRAMSTVRSVDIVVEPEVLYPDSESSALIDVQLRNVFGWRSWTTRRAQFRIVEGGEFGTLVRVDALSARVYARFTPGTIIVQVLIDDVPLPYEVRVPIRYLYAFSGGSRPHCSIASPNVRNAGN